MSPNTCTAFADLKVDGSHLIPTCGDLMNPYSV